MNRYKTEILSVETFLDNRPDLAVHSELAIQSAIYASASVLNSICNNLISEVWDYNNVQDTGLDGGMFAPDPSSPLYRTRYELELIKEAFIHQTQYTINLGNDYTTGSTSGNLGGVNFSTNRNENQSTIAPAVLTLLQKARVYVIDDVFSANKKECKKDTFYNSAITPNEDIDCPTFATADNRYLRQYQPNVKAGRILSVNENKMVEWVENVALTDEDKKNLTEALKKNKEDIEELQAKVPTFATIDEIAQISEQLTNDYTNNNNLQIKLDDLRKDIKEKDIKPLEIETTAQWLRISLVEADTKDNKQKIGRIESYLKDGYIIRFRGIWKDDVNYAAFDYVMYNDRTYFALKPSVRIVPDANPEYWKLQELTQQVDLTDYYTKSETNIKLNDYYDKKDFLEIADNNNIFINAKEFSGEIDEDTRITINGRSIELECGAYFSPISQEPREKANLAIFPYGIAGGSGEEIDEEKEFYVRGLSTPLVATDATNKAYVDNINEELKNKYEALSKRLELLETNTNKSYFAEFKCFDGSIVVYRVVDSEGNTIKTDGTGVGVRFTGGNTDQNKQNYHYTKDGVFGSSLTYTEMTGWGGYVWANIKIVAVINNIRYKNSQYIYIRNEYDYDFAHGYMYMPLVKTQN